MKFIAPLLVVLSLTGCAEAQQNQDQNLVDDGVSVEAIVTVKNTLEKTPLKDPSQMSIAELQTEIEKIKEKIASLEAVIDTFKEEDPKWDVLDIYNERFLELVRAETAAEKAETAADLHRGKRLDVITEKITVHEEVVPTQTAVEESLPKDPSKMSRAELRVKIDYLEKKIVDMKESGASIRKIILVRKELLALEKAETAAEKEETEAVKQRVDESTQALDAAQKSTNIAKILAGEKQ